MVFQRVGIPRFGGTTFWRLLGHGLFLPGLRKEVFPTRPGDTYGGYRWEKSQAKAVVGMCANPLEREHSILVLSPLAWNIPEKAMYLRVSRCNTAVRPFTSKFRPRLDALIALWPSGPPVNVLKNAGNHR